MPVDWLLAGAALGGTVGLTLTESFLQDKPAIQLLGTAWVVVSFFRWLSGSRPAETPEGTEVNTNPRKFLARRALRASVCAIPLGVDIFCSTSSEWVRQWIPHNTDAEQSLRCSGGSIGFFILILVNRKSILLPSMTKIHKFFAVIGGLSLSIGPGLALRYDPQDRGLAVIAALSRVAWILLFSTHYISDVVKPKVTVHSQRILFWAVVFVLFTLQDNSPTLVLSGAGMAMFVMIVFYLQNPLLSLCILSVTGAGMSLSELQIGMTLFSVLCLICSRYSCRRPPSFQRLSPPPSTSENDSV